MACSRSELPRRTPRAVRNNTCVDDAARNDGNVAPVNGNSEPQLLGQRLEQRPEYVDCRSGPISRDPCHPIGHRQHVTNILSEAWSVNACRSASEFNRAWSGNYGKRGRVMARVAGRVAWLTPLPMQDGTDRDRLRQTSSSARRPFKPRLGAMIVERPLMGAVRPFECLSWAADWRPLLADRERSPTSPLAVVQNIPGRERLRCGIKAQRVKPASLGHTIDGFLRHLKARSASVKDIRAPNLLVATSVAYQ